MPPDLARLTAALSRSYLVERDLGAGGMATVYLAHDLKHDRDVAIKVLHPDLGAALGSERFLSEIRTTARLQHPHILPLLDSGEADGLLYYVMPLVTGETLRSRLEREGQLPIEDALRVAREVADALEYAHEHHVIHRDIKPENILLQGGHALVADFGIALAVQSAGGARMTQTGLSLGTPQYMSPEQAMGERAIDARSDIYALGAVTYEMLAGDPPFTGSSVQAIVAKVLTERPPSILIVRDTVPEGVETAVLRALAKLPADRFSSAKAFADALASQATAAPSTSRLTTSARHNANGKPMRRTLAIGAIAVLASIVAAVGWLRPAAPATVSRLRVTLWRHPVGQFLSPGIERQSTQAAIAPDGSSIVFTDSVGGVVQLMRKLRNESEPTPLAGTERGVTPFFSPDGAWIGFLTTDGKVKKIPTRGGGSITIADNVASTYYAAAWLDDNTIVYVDSRADLRRIPADGGVGTVVLSDSARGRRPTGAIAPLPGSRGFLFTTCPGNCVSGSDVSVFDLAADSAWVLVKNAAGAWYSPTGHLLYTDRTGGLYAAAFNLKRLALTSGAVPILDDVMPNSFALSASGSALYSLGGSGGDASALTWVARDGSATPLDSTWHGQFEYPTISPDGNSIAVSLRDATTQLWLRRSDGTRQRLTQDGTINWRTSWSPDGRSLAFVSNLRGGATQDDIDIYQMPIDGSAQPTLLHRHIFGLWEAELSRDGQWLVYRSDEGAGQINIRARRLTGDTSSKRLVVGKGSSMQAALSPDGHWLAYASDISGQREIYVVPFPDGESTRLVSRDGGTEPRWAHSGHELFYKSGNWLVAAPVMPGPTLSFGTPRPLFSLAGYLGARNRQQYDVAPDDQKFLMIKLLHSDTRGEAIYVENWFAELESKLRSKGKP